MLRDEHLLFTVGMTAVHRGFCSQFSVHYETDRRGQSRHMSRCFYVRSRGTSQVGLELLWCGDALFFVSYRRGAHVVYLRRVLCCHLYGVKPIVLLGICFIVSCTHLPGHDDIPGV